MRESRKALLILDSSESSTVMRDQRVWSMKECATVFSDCLTGLKEEFAKQGENGMLVWDKVRNHNYSHQTDYLAVK
jgi:hypothetical protein